MAELEMIDQLIATYRELNHNVRPQQVDGSMDANRGVRDIVRKMRDHELRFSQDLKARISGQPVSFDETQELATLGTETDHDSTASLIAQFGTAREATLAMLRDLNREGWEAAQEGGTSIRNDVQALIENDKQALAAIGAAAGVATG
jgi:hypothetical protein